MQVEVRLTDSPKYFDRKPLAIGQFYPLKNFRDEAFRFKKNRRIKITEFDNTRIEYFQVHM